MPLIVLLQNGMEVHAEGDALDAKVWTNESGVVELKSLLTNNKVLVRLAGIVLVELLSKEEYDSRMAEQAATRAERSGRIALPSMRIPRKSH